MVTSAKYHTYGWYLSRPQISQICTDTLVASNRYSLCLIAKNSEGVEICDNLCNLWEKFNIQHLTFNITITVYGYKKLYEAGTGSALFPRFVTRGGKCSSDALDLSQSRPSEEAS